MGLGSSERPDISGLAALLTATEPRRVRRVCPVSLHRESVHPPRPECQRDGPHSAAAALLWQGGLVARRCLRVLLRLGFSARPPRLPAQCRAVPPPERRRGCRQC